MKKYLVLAYFNDENETAKYVWFDTEEEARKWIEGYRHDFPEQFVLDEFWEIGEMRKLN